MRRRAIALMRDPRHSATALGVLLPGLEECELAISDCDLSTRAFNCLGRAGIELWGELSSWRIASLEELRGAGVGTVDEITLEVVRFWAESQL